MENSNSPHLNPIAHMNIESKFMQITNNFEERLGGEEIKRTEDEKGSQGRTRWKIKMGRCVVGNGFIGKQMPRGKRLEKRRGIRIGKQKQGKF